MLEADRPITSSAQDQLGRTVFAKYLARCMLDHKNPESLVIGLQGGWGSGKTSLINLVLEELQFASSNMFDDEKPIILNFSPWSYSGQQQIIYGFYRRLSLQIKQFSYLTQRERISYLLELYISFFSHLPVPKSLRLKRFFTKTAGLAWESGRDPTQVKAELNELLQNQKHKVIIMIDNISRLEAKEINQVFQIVKSMADYMNTIYLLAFDEPQVIHAIDKLHPGEGASYLEKVVQLPFDVPEISKQDLEKLFFDRLEKVMTPLPEGRWDSTYWADLYSSALKDFFNSCRDITRFTNTLGFIFPRVRDVVNPVDFVALTAIEVFEPFLFAALHENKDLFTDLLENVYVFDAEKLKKDKSRCDEILGRATKENRDIVLKLLMQLFPRLRSMYEPNEAFFHSEKLARKNLRVCSPDVFDIYFRLSIPTGFMPLSKVDTILALAYDRDSFEQALLRLNQDDRVTKFLDLLDHMAAKKIELKNIPNVISALLDTADLFPEGNTNPLSFSTSMRVHRICHQLLRCVKKEDERFTILRDAIEKSNKSLFTLVNEINLQKQEHIESEDTYVPMEHRDLTTDRLYQLQEMVVQKIAFWARIGRLGEHPQLLPVLYAWKEWGSEEDARRYVASLIKEDRGLLAFLTAIFQVPITQTVTNLEKSSDWDKYLNDVTAFIPISQVETRAKAVFEDENFEKLREREQLAILIFLDLINAQTVKVIPKTTV